MKPNEKLRDVRAENEKIKPKTALRASKRLFSTEVKG